MSDVDSTSEQPSMTATSTMPVTTSSISAAPLEMLPAVDTIAGSGGNGGSTSFPASITRLAPDSTEITQIPSTEMPTRTIPQTFRAVEVEDATNVSSGPAADNDTVTTAAAAPVLPASQPTPPSLSSSSPQPPIPETTITFLLVTGKRRTMSFPSSSTIGRVKELVWNSWSADWSDDRPPTPNFLRILYLGKMLQDDDVLESALHALFPESQPGSSTPTIVHVSIRPVAPSTIAADDMKKRKRGGVGRISVGRNGANSSSGGGGDEGGGGCCCVIC